MKRVTKCLQTIKHCLLDNKNCNFKKVLLNCSSSILILSKWIPFSITYFYRAAQENIDDNGLINGRNQIVRAYHRNDYP